MKLALDDTSRSRFRLLTALLVLLAWVHPIGCARIYRPIIVAPTPVQVLPGEIRPSIGFQPWGDNSRYRDRAQKVGIRMLVLTVDNGTDRNVHVSIDPGSVPGERLSPSGATALIKQSLWGYSFYPIGSLIALPPIQTGAWAELGNAICWTSFGITLAVGISNGAVAASSNRKLENFFSLNGWSDGEVTSGGRRLGLLLFQVKEAHPSLKLRLLLLDAGVTRTIDVPLPEGPLGESP